MVESKAMLCLLQRPNDKGQREIDTLYIITRRIQVRADTSAHCLESYWRAFRPRWEVSRSLRAHSPRCGSRSPSGFHGLHLRGAHRSIVGGVVAIQRARQYQYQTVGHEHPLDMCTGRQMRVQADEQPRCGGRGDARSREGEHHVHHVAEVEQEEHGHGKVRGECDYEVYDPVAEEERPERGPPGYQEEPSGREIITVRSKNIAEEATMSTRRLYPGRRGRRTVETLKIKPQVLGITSRNEHADFNIRINTDFRQRPCKSGSVTESRRSIRKTTHPFRTCNIDQYLSTIKVD